MKKVYKSPCTETIDIEVQPLLSESVGISKGSYIPGSALVKGQKVHSFDVSWE